jgi:hypothetical protein
MYIKKTSPGKKNPHTVLYTPTDLITCACYLAFTPSQFPHICAVTNSTLYRPPSTTLLQLNTSHRSKAENKHYSSGKLHGQQQMFYSRLLSGKESLFSDSGDKDDYYSSLNSAGFLSPVPSLPSNKPYYPSELRSSQIPSSDQ